MPIAIEEVNWNSLSIYTDMAVGVRVEVSGSDDPLAVMVNIPSSGVSISLRRFKETSVWYALIFGSQIGACAGEPVNIIATNGVYSAINSTINITVAERGYADPSKFTEALLESHWDANKANGIKMPEHACITDVKRLNRVNDWILILEGPRVVEERARGYFYNVTYPVTLELHSKDRGRVRDILTEVNRILELYWNNLNTYHYDYIEFDDKGSDRSMASANIWKFVYNFRLIKVYKPMEGVL